MPAITNFFSYLFASIASANFLLLQLSSQPGTELSVMEYLMVNGGIGAILLFIWFLTYKSANKNQAVLIKQLQTQFAQSLDAQKEQNSLNLEMMNKQHKMTLEVIKEQLNNSNQKYIELSSKMLDYMKEGNAHTAVLGTILTEIKTRLEK